MHLYLSVLLEWANNDPRWDLLLVIPFLPFGILSFPPFMKRYGSNYGNNDLTAFFSLNLSAFCTFSGILSLFDWLNILSWGIYVAIIVPLIYAATLYQYYFRWTDKGYKFQEEEKKKKEEKEQKKKEEARRNKYL